MDCGIVVSEFEPQSRYLHSLSDKSPWKRYEGPNPPRYLSFSMRTLALSNPQMLIWRKRKTKQKQTKPMPKPPLQGGCGSISFIAAEDRRVNVTVRVEFELNFSDVAVEYLNRNAMGTSHQNHNLPVWAC